MSTTVALAAAVLFGVGTYLVMQRKLSRIVIGLGLLSHGANVLLMSSGRPGVPPLIGRGDPADFSDPLPHAFALTTIVISFGVTAFLLALAYRSYLLTHDDEVEDDLGDRALARGHDDDTEVADERLAGVHQAAFGPGGDDATYLPLAADAEHLPGRSTT